MPVSFEDIRAAAERIKGRVAVTPCSPSIALSEATGANIFCKLEQLQRTGSFKERGACNALLQLSTSQKKNGVIAASAGNHALGLSYHGKLLGIPVTVVMPVTAPLTKATNCRHFGATVILHGETIDESRAHADEILAQHGQTYINGFDDPAVIAGQGTMGLEIIEQVPELDAIIVPIGGAGLIAGVALAIKSLKPSVEVIGVEPRRAASFTAALQDGEPVRIKISLTLADGLAVPQVGANAFQIAREHVDRVLLVDEHDIALAILRLAELEKSVVEGAGAAPLAACLAGLVPELKERNVVLPLCGGNIDTNIFGRVLERGLVSDGRLCRFSTSISDRPGGLSRLATVIAEEGASIVDIAHDRAFGSDDINLVTVHCIVETRDPAHIQSLYARLASSFPNGNLRTYFSGSS
ncbi:MAG: threonine ammonia-lyase [Verrucomicrobiota bacterium]